MEVKSYYVYILASKKNGTLYSGVTNDLLRRVHEHKGGAAAGFTKRYSVDKLVYYETFAKVYDALTAEKRLKAWKRQWKIELIEEHNPQWHDLYDVLTGPVDSCFRRNDRVGSGGSLRILGKDRVDGVRSSCISRVRDRPYCHACESRNPGTGRSQKAFTLIELLVVIAILALLMAILMPCLQRVRKQARAVACQANLGQWGILYATYAADNDGFLPSRYNRDHFDWVAAYWRSGSATWKTSPYHPEAQLTTLKGVFCCPMAT